MPTRHAHRTRFLGWVQDHKEAREIYRSCAQPGIRSNAVGRTRPSLRPSTGGEWEEQVRANIARGWPADYKERGYIPPDWRKVYPEIGGPPVSATESREAYTISSTP